MKTCCGIDSTSNLFNLVHKFGVMYHNLHFSVVSKAFYPSQYVFSLDIEYKKVTKGSEDSRCKACTIYRTHLYQAKKLVKMTVFLCCLPWSCITWVQWGYSTLSATRCLSGYKKKYIFFSEALHFFPNLVLLILTKHRQWMLKEFCLFSSVRHSFIKRHMKVHLRSGSFILSVSSFSSCMRKKTLLVSYHICECDSSSNNSLPHFFPTVWGNRCATHVKWKGWL